MAMARDACFEKIALSLDKDEHYQNEIYTISGKDLAKEEWLNANGISIDGFDPNNPDETNQLRFTVIGLVFLLFGILPGFYFGKYGALLLLKKLSGGTVGSTVYVKAAVVAGIGVGIICAAAISVVIAGLLCMAVDSMRSTSVARR